ncbi:MAG: 50S ribosomal protein L11 methyltransferase [Betaproteobacteria bacterium]|nr:50S ribosomal protein L11 methyltransferase [Betaproteobacteria bacterium]NBY14709.1 50S ribosomal protein L11 methyltransferase [Betaproteobacteria bacterium]
MGVHELVFDFDQGQIALDALTDQLLAAGALSVAVSDRLGDNPEREQPLFGEPGSAQGLRAWPVSRLTVHLNASDDPARWWQEQSVLHPTLRDTALECRMLQDRDWVSETQRDFSPICVKDDVGRDRIWVGPSWSPMPPAFETRPRIGLSIDPGMAFGTGAHATTQLCLEAILQALDRTQVHSMLDMGTGSGILAIAAAKLGVREVVGLDIDPIAVSTARDNAERNGVCSDQLRFDSAQSVPPRCFDLVVANILAQPLRLLAPMLWSLVRPGGGLVLSGILSRQADLLIEAYCQSQPARPTLARLGEREGWVCLGVHAEC